MPRVLNGANIHSLGDCNVQPRLRTLDLGGERYSIIENQWSRPVALKLKFALESPFGLVKNPDSEGLECGLRICFRNKFPGKAGPHVENH